MNTSLQDLQKYADARAAEGKDLITIVGGLGRNHSVSAEHQPLLVEIATQAIAQYGPKQVAVVQTAVAVADEPEAETETSEPVADEPISFDALAGKPVAAAATSTEVSTKSEADPLPEFPASLKSINNWVRWKLELGSNGKMTKVPYQVNGYKASSTNPSDWTDYRTATTGWTIDNTQGVGFVFDGKGVVGFDLDGCRNPETGVVAEWAEQLVDELDSYTEITPSQTGLHVLVRGELPQDFDNVLNLDPAVGFGAKVKIEIFDTERYFTVTGDAYLEEPIGVSRDLSEAYQLCLDIQAKHPAPKAEKVAADGTVSQSVQVEKIGEFETRKYDIFMNGTVETLTPFVISDGNGRLTYPSHSEADMALATVLAIKFDGDAGKIDAEFRASKLMRGKWERDDYRANTIAQAIKSAEKLKAAEAAKEAQLAADAAAKASHEYLEQYAMTAEEIGAELEKDYPVIPFVALGGPSWDNDVLYGPLGDITRKACASSEAHPAGVYLDLIVSAGNIFGRTAYFTVDSKHHYTNEFMVRVGATSKSRKGTARGIVNNVLGLVDIDWYTNRVMSGFGSAEAIVNEVRDPRQQRVSSKKNGTISFQLVMVPGVDDKRLCIREDEIASVFLLASKRESRADIIFRDGWDGSPFRNIVKGQNQSGLSNSATCMEPHLSISGDTTREELMNKIPDGSAENGFGNRFLWCYVQRLKKCPMGSPPMDWSAEVTYLHNVKEFAKTRKYMPLSSAASRLFKGFYMDSSLESVGLVGKMTDRAIPHIRRIAMILALVDMSEVVESKHVKAARRLWDYCQDSAEYIFSGTTKDQNRIVSWVRQQAAVGPVTVPMITQQLFQRNRKADWVRAQVTELVRMGKLLETDGQIKVTA